MMRNNSSRIPDFNSFRTHSGNKHKQHFSTHYRDDGTIELTPTYQSDIKAEINSHASETDMAMIIARLQMGDQSVVNQRPAMYGDFTVFPKTYADMLTLVNRAEDAFMSLDPEMRAKYNNDKNQWFASIGSENWLRDMGLIIDPPNTIPSGDNTNE